MICGVCLCEDRLCCRIVVSFSAGEWEGAKRRRDGRSGKARAGQRMTHFREQNVLAEGLICQDGAGVVNVVEDVLESKPFGYDRVEQRARWLEGVDRVGDVSRVEESRSFGMGMCMEGKRNHRVWSVRWNSEAASTGPEGPEWARVGIICWAGQMDMDVPWAQTHTNRKHKPHSNLAPSQPVSKSAKVFAEQSGRHC